MASYMVGGPQAAACMVLEGRAMECQQPGSGGGQRRPKGAPQKGEPRYMDLEREGPSPAAPGVAPEERSGRYVPDDSTDGDRVRWPELGSTVIRGRQKSQSIKAVTK